MAYYWYQNDPVLYEGEVRAMQKFFPSFTIHQLDDGSGRLYWRGTVQPYEGGAVWDLMLIYKNDHPHAIPGEYGGSIQILPVSPRLKDIAAQLPSRPEVGLGLGLPHVYRDYFGRNEEYFICTADPRYVNMSLEQSSSAAKCLAWACKWILLCEMWLRGELPDDVGIEGVY